ncbi:MAG TPA: hypothetical protein VFQ86_03225 [Arachidicoccus soli]|nr:hypothetical protein [Arachidicoccus soli]
MAFVDAGRALQQQLSLWADYTKRQPALDAILTASKMNNYINTDLANQMKFTGKKRNVIVTSYLPQCDAVADDCSDSLCDGGNTIQPEKSEFSIGKCISTRNYELDPDNVRLIDGNIGFSDNAVMQVLSLLSDLRRKLAKAVVADLVANVGTHNDGSASKQISFTDPSDAALRPLGLWEIQKEFEDIGLENPFIVGGADVFTWLQAVRYGGLNQQGIQTGQLPTSNMYYDALVDNAFADKTKGHVIAFDPRMVKFISYNKNAGIFATTPYDSIRDLDALYRTAGNSIKGTYQDPVTGLLFDLNVLRVDCPDEKFVFNIRLEWDLWYPPNFFCADDAGVNGIFAYDTCKTVPAACPTT